MNALSPLLRPGYEGECKLHKPAQRRSVRKTLTEREDGFPSSPQPAATLRYSDRPTPMTNRLLGLAGTACLFLMLVGVGLLRWLDTPHFVISTTPAMTLVEVTPPQAPPAPPSEKRHAPDQAERDIRPAKPATRPVPALKLPSSVPAVARAAISSFELIGNNTAASAANAVGALPATLASAPESRSVPHSPKAADERAKWAGLVLAALQRAKRYPHAAIRTRQEGTSWIRFTVDRRGRVRSAHLQRSSGVESLDQEALDLPIRAQPLPKPPKAVAGHRIELIVPIEFFLH